MVAKGQSKNRQSSSQVGKDRHSIPRAVIAAVEPGSAADRAGLTAGMAILTAEGEPLRDLIDWRWQACDETVELEVEDTSGAVRRVRLYREEGEDWGLDFAEVVFDGLRLCANDCCFCFLKGLAPEVRPSLLVRDDDYRLSFLSGTFITLTNLRPFEVDRIIEQGLSPLRVSLHAVDSAVRQELMGGAREAAGMAALRRLLDAGIEIHGQVVLVPGLNDGAVLEATLTWAYDQPGILSLAAVPVGYTRLNPLQRGFDHPDEALAVLQTLEPFQVRAEADGRGMWVYGADELYLKAYGVSVLDHLPTAERYGDFELFEDGVGVVRVTADEFAVACEQGDDAALKAALDRWHSQSRLKVIVGEAVAGWMERLIAASALQGRVKLLVVPNDTLGGNVDVTGLLCGADVAAALTKDSAQRAQDPDAGPVAYALPRIMFNDEGLTLDDWTFDDLVQKVGAPLTMVSLIERSWMADLAAFVASWDG